MLIIEALKQYKHDSLFNYGDIHTSTNGVVIFVLIIQLSAESINDNYFTFTSCVIDRHWYKFKVM